MNWRDHLTPTEAARYAELEALATEASAERRKIYERAWKRAKRAA
jgi:hypothetical protein